MPKYLSKEVWNLRDSLRRAKLRSADYHKRLRALEIRVRDLERSRDTWKKRCHARYLAFKHEVALIRNSQGVPTAWISRRVGGEQIDYADETAEVRNMFAEALAKHGIDAAMDDAYARELDDLPPKAA